MSENNSPWLHPDDRVDQRINLTENHSNHLTNKPNEVKVNEIVKLNSLNYVTPAPAGYDELKPSVYVTFEKPKHDKYALWSVFFLVIFFPLSIFLSTKAILRIRSGKTDFIKGDLEGSIGVLCISSILFLIYLIGSSI